METFDTLKDFDVDFRDMRESNSQYDVIFETFAKVFEDLLYQEFENIVFRSVHGSAKSAASKERSA